MKPLILTLSQWSKIYSKIGDTYPRSVWLIRDNMKKVLGFTPREHQEWIVKHPTSRMGHYQTRIHLDFFDEQQRTMFLLKYADYLREELEYD